MDKKLKVNSESISNYEENNVDPKIILRFLSFWPYFVFFTIFCIVIAFLFVRYSDSLYVTKAKIEILDKSQDSEMALPTAMTIFNRSMINLDNEIGRLKSYILNERVNSELKSNIRFFWNGNIKDTEKHHSEFFDDYKFELKVDSDTISEFSLFELDISKNKMAINQFDEEENLIQTFNFNSLSTLAVNHKLPFDLEIYNDKMLDENLSLKRSIIFLPFVENLLSKIELLEFSQSIITATSSFADGSDQIIITSEYRNKKISEEYLNTLINLFDRDGISERQLEYASTIRFVDERSVFLEQQLGLIENKKQSFKESNNLSDLKFNADYSVNQIGQYDSEVFELESQLELLELFKREILENDFSLLPINFGLLDSGLNELISQYNNLVIEKDKLLNSGAGSNNSLVINTMKQMDNLFINIQTSVNSYYNNLSLNIESLTDKENEFSSFFSNVPENERILRSIERELQVKEALYLLLLQKKEEAAINFAVVKPTIKIIDFARSDPDPIYPNKKMIFLLALSAGVLLPFLAISLWFYLDNKIHTKDDLKVLDIPILAEIPYIANSDFLIENISSSSRDQLTESIRMLSTNLKFVLKNDVTQNILITSTVKGEGKTLISSHLSKILSFGSKVILIGSDLRNPQIHKHLGVSKDMNKGLSDYLYRDKITIDDIIFSSSENLDIILSGVIPPNPTELLQKQKFKKLIEILKNSGKYDYIIVDSAPYLLVSDTFQIANLFDCTLSVVRANHTEKALLKYIEENKSVFNNLCLCLKSLGNSQSYGYKYNYQYGYKYGYAYNYGYGYGYGNDEDETS